MLGQIYLALEYVVQRKAMFSPQGVPLQKQQGLPNPAPPWGYNAEGTRSRRMPFLLLIIWCEINTKIFSLLRTIINFPISVPSTEKEGTLRYSSTKYKSIFGYSIHDAIQTTMGLIPNLLHTLLPPQYPSSLQIRKLSNKLLPTGVHYRINFLSAGSRTHRFTPDPGGNFVSY